MENELKSFDPDVLFIDVNILPYEWAEHPRLVGIVGKELVLSRKRVKDWKNELNLVDAEITLKIRRFPGDFDIPKGTRITDSIATAIITLDKKHQRVLAKLEEEEELEGMLEAFLKALEHKKKGLEKEVEMQIAGIFSTPLAKETSARIIKEMRDKVFFEKTKIVNTDRMNKKPKEKTTMGVIMKTIEGYWRKSIKNDESNLPFPIASDVPWKGKGEFLIKLQEKEATARQNHCKGCSDCRICGCMNGSIEFEFGNWRWPEGFRHYVKKHNVQPSFEFVQFILKED